MITIFAVSSLHSILSLWFWYETGLRKLNCVFICQGYKGSNPGKYTKIRSEVSRTHITLKQSLSELSKELKIWHSICPKSDRENKVRCCFLWHVSRKLSEFLNCKKLVASVKLPSPVIKVTYDMCSVK